MGPSRVSDVKFEPFRSRKQNSAYREMTGSPPAPKLVRCAFESFSTAARSQCLSQFLDRFSGLCFDRRERSNVRHRQQVMRSDTTIATTFRGCSPAFENLA